MSERDELATEYIRSKKAADEWDPTPEGLFRAGYAKGYDAHAERVKGLITALEYYADAAKYIAHGKCFGVPLEKGEKAREALARYKEGR